MMRLSRRARRWAVAAAVVAVAVVAGFAYHQHRYPFGWSHCCDKYLHLVLLDYAERHDGWYPRGEDSPEASLSLLYRDEPGLANLLRGKTVPEEVVRERLDRGQPLNPETCGWHYVEGLRRGDDGRLALFWDKAGLGHNGERLSGGRWVTRLSGIDYIPSDRWDEFLAEQEQLRAAVKRP